MHGPFDIFFKNYPSLTNGVTHTPLSTCDKSNRAVVKFENYITSKSNILVSEESQKTINFQIYLLDMRHVRIYFQTA